MALALDTPTGGKTGNVPATTTCPTDAIRSTPAVGSTYTVLGIHPDDAYSGSPTVSIGETVTFEIGRAHV